MKNSEIIYKGLTRKATIFGVPSDIYMIVFVVILLLSFYIYMPIFFAIVPITFVLKELFRRDEFIFELLLLKFKFAFTNNKFYNTKSYNSISYEKLSNKNNFPKMSVIGLNEQPSIEKYLPYQTLIGDIVITKDFDLMGTWQVDGIFFETQDENFIATHKNNLNMILRSFGVENVSFYIHNCRVSIKDSFNSKFHNDFLKDFDEEYFKGIKEGLLKENKLFITLIYSPISKFIKKSLKNDSLEARNKELNIHISNFKKIAKRLESNLRDFNPKRLGIYEENKGYFSSQLEFYNYLIGGRFVKVRIPKCQIDEYLTGSINNIMFNQSSMQINLNDGKKKFAKAIEIKDYTNTSITGMLNSLLYLKVEYTITQSFTPIPQADARSSLTQKQKKLIQAEDDSFSQIEEISLALDELASGELIFGDYHFSLVVYGDSLKDVEDKSNKVITELNNLGFLAVIANIALTATYYAQFPANFEIRPRKSILSSRNFASLNALHNFEKGKRDKNPWGEAVTILKTPNGQPYYFNFHETHKDVDNFNDLLLANTLIIGKSGGGKTALMNFLLNQLCKYSNINTFPTNLPDNKKKCSFFYLDKDRGAIGNIVANGGEYLSIKAGEPTGFNPFMIENNPSNIRNIQILMKMLVTRNGEILSTLEEENLNNAVLSIMNNFEMRERKFGISLMLNHLTEDMNDTNSLKSRLALWANGNKFGWVFDNEFDKLDFNKNVNIFGIDGTDLLADNDISGAVAYYLLWRITDLADGRRFALFIDEAWDWIKNQVVAEEIHNKEKTIRKLNGFLILGTQSVEDFARSNIATAILEQSETKILLSNPSGRESDYCDKLDLSQEEFEFVKTTLPNEYQFLVKKSSEKAIATIDLSYMDKKFLKIISTGRSYVESIENINSNKNLTYEQKLNKLYELYE